MILFITLSFLAIFTNISKFSDKLTNHSIKVNKLVILQKLFVLINF